MPDSTWFDACLFIPHVMFEVPAKKEVYSSLFSYRLCSLWGVPLSSPASWKPLQRAYPAILGLRWTVLSISRRWYTLKGMHMTGLASLPAAKQYNLAVWMHWNKLNSEALWIVWLLTLLRIPSPVSVWTNLTLAAWIHNPIRLVTAQSFWLRCRSKHNQTDKDLCISPELSSAIIQWSVWIYAAASSTHQIMGMTLF